MSDSSPSIVPGIDQDVFLVVDDFGSFGRTWRESNFGDTGLDTVASDLLEGQFYNPVLVVGFNIAEGWCRDFSEAVAQELQKRCADHDRELPPFLEEFMSRHGKATTR